MFLSACSGCPAREEEPVQIGSSTLLLKNKPVQTPQATGPKVRVINIGPSKEENGSGDMASGAAMSDTFGVSVSIPSDVGIDSGLTGRLKDKLKEAFADRGSSPPDIDIYTGVMSLDSFARYYEDRGYKIQRTSVPAAQVIEPLLSERPELAAKVNLSNYAGININQVVVEGANISAADKYIDPETYEVVYKTFVTVTKTK